jgi:16S rRNA (guanine527-N7)-methyltransferase
LVGVRSLEDLVRLQLLDCLHLHRLLPSFSRALDLGSGNGLPGIPLAILRPDSRFSLLDSRPSRLRFLQRVIWETGLTNVELLEGRAEELARGGQRESFEAVLARAVAPLPVLLELGLPFVQLGGALYALKGPRAQEEWQKAEGAASLLGGELEEVWEYALPSSRERRVLVIRKKTVTPPLYPRRSGVPARRPLGG